MTAFSWAPQTAEKKTQPRVRVARMGEGYEQRVGDGINTMPALWSLTWSSDKATIDAIEAYLVTAAGVTSFLWTPPGEATQIRVVCREWSRTQQQGLKVAQMAAEFQQVFGE